MRYANPFFPAQAFGRPRAKVSRPFPWQRLAAAILLILALGTIGWAAVQAYRAVMAPMPAPAPNPEPEPSGSALPGAGHRRAALSESGASAQETVSDSAEPAEAVEAIDDEAGASAPKLVGKVMSAADEPIAGAEVFALDMRDERIARPVSMVARARSDEAGRFVLDYPAEASGVLVRAAGYEGVGLPYQDVIREARVEMHVHLRRALTIEGCVVDEQGAPVAGVRIGDLSDCLLGGAAGLGKTGADGRFSVAMGRQEMLTFSHPDFAPRTIPMQGSDEALRVVLGPGGDLRVQVMGAEAPMDGVDVIVWPEERGRFGERAEATTGPDGYVSFTHLPVGSPLRMAALLDAGARMAVQGETITLAAGEKKECTFALPAIDAAAVRGTVRGPGGGSVEGARLVVSQGDPSAGGGVVQWVEPGPKGLYEATVSEGKVTVKLELPAGSGLRAANGAQREIEVSFGQTTVVEEFRVVQCEPLEVSLVDADGEPVEQAYVAIPPYLCSYPAEVQWFVEAPGGRFVVTSGAFSTISAYDLSMTVGGKAELAQPCSSVEVVLDLPLAFIEGRVTTPDGRPVPEVQVGVGQLGSSRWGIPAGGVETDAVGRFRIVRLPSDLRYRLSFIRSGYAVAEPSLYESVRPGGEPLAVEMLVEDAPISGKVVALDGSPAAGAIVKAMDPVSHRGRSTGTVGADGTFSFLVAPGRYVLSAVTRDFIYTPEVSVEAPAERVVLTVPVSTIVEYPEVDPPTGPAHEKAARGLKTMGLAFKLFALEAARDHFPLVDPAPGVFLPEAASLPQEEAAAYLKESDTDLCYLGYVALNELTGLAILDAYRQADSEGIQTDRLTVAEGVGTNGHDTIFGLREGVERHLIRDPNDPNEAAAGQSRIPVMWEMPDQRAESGGWVLFMDGHVDWVPYPGPFPMTPGFIQQLRADMAVGD